MGCFSRNITAAALAACLAAACFVAPASALAGDGLAAASAQAGSVAVKAQAASSSKSASAKPAKPTAKQLKAFKKASADFSVDLFKRCVSAKGANGNVAIAPMSVMNALALSANGAGGKTRAQMRDVIGDGASMTRINKNLAWYNSKLTNTGKARIRVANSIWYHDDGALKMKKKFLKVAKSSYKAQVSAADFSSRQTVDSINAWVAEKTNNMIKSVVDRLSPEDRIAIVNALYFDAEWRAPYDKSDVHESAFTNAKGAKRKVDMMYGTERTYIEGSVAGKGVTGFVKPYVKGYRYVALLPDKGVSLKSFAKRLTGDDFRRLVNSATTATVHTGLPKYSLSYSNEGMERQLRAMGIDEAFTPGADLSNMGTDKAGNLYLGSVVHKTKVDLDEKGTKAAAATAVFARTGAAYDPDSKMVILDRPFMYAIVDNATNLPVFIGAVNNVGA